MQIVPLANGDEQFLQMTLVAGASSVSFLAASFSGHRSEAVVALDTEAPSTAVENCANVCVCVRYVCYARLRSRTIEQGGLSLICHLSRQHLLLSGEAQQVMGSSL